MQFLTSILREHLSPQGLLHWNSHVGFKARTSPNRRHIVSFRFVTILELMGDEDLSDATQPCLASLHNLMISCLIGL